MEEKNLTVVKSNSLIQASYRLSLGEKRLLLACIAKLDSKGVKYAKDDGVTVTAREFTELFEIKSNNAYRDLEDAAEKLFERKITFDDKPRKIKYVSRWASDMDYNYGEGSVTIHFSQRILPYITQLEARFTQYRLERVATLTSTHAIRIYELCLQYLKLGHRKFETEHLKKILGVESEYPEFKDFNKRVIKPSLEQINRRTDLNIKIERIRKLRKIVALKFIIKQKSKTSHKASAQKMNTKFKKMGEILEDTTIQ